MIIVHMNAFCITLKGEIGIADGRSYASLAWNMGDDVLANVLSTQMSWIDAEGLAQVGHKAFFRRPTFDEIKNNITPGLIEIAVIMGLIKEDASETDKAAN